MHKLLKAIVLFIFITGCEKSLSNILAKSKTGDDLRLQFFPIFNWM